MWEAFTAYGLQILLGLIAFFALWKDWTDYRSRSQKWGKPIQLVLALATILILVFGLLDTHLHRRDAEKDRQQAQLNQQRSDGEVQSLGDQIQQMRADSKDDRDAFRVSFDNLYRRFADLQSKTDNADLTKQLKDTEQELRNTQAKLVQPKANTFATFFPARPFADQTPITESTLPSSGQPLAVDFSVTNPTDVAALNGEITLVICDACRFATEPDGFVKRNGSPETARNKPFAHILPHSILEKMTADVISPPNATRFEIDIIVNCDTCESGRVQRLYVNLR